MSKKIKKEDRYLESIVIIGKFSDGKYRQIILNNQDTEQIVISAVLQYEKSIKVLDRELPITIE